MSAETHRGETEPTSPIDWEPPFRVVGRPGEVGQLGHYRILKKVGRVHSWLEYLAFDERTLRKTTLYVLNTNATDSATIDRTVEHIRLAARITSDHVLPIVSFGNVDGLTYVAMPYREGKTLQQYLSQVPQRDINHAMRIAREILEGLAVAHEIVGVHRQLHPATILLEAPHGRVKILGYGLIEPSAVHTTAYTAPEQRLGMAIGHRTDLYSVGCMLYEMLTGVLPEHGNMPAEIDTNSNTAEPQPIQQLRPEVPAELVELTHRLLAKDMTQRPETAIDAVLIIRRMERNDPLDGATKPVPISITATEDAVWRVIEDDPAYLPVEPEDRINDRSPPGVSRRFTITGMILLTVIAIASAIQIALKVREQNARQEAARLQNVQVTPPAIEEIPPELKLPKRDPVFKPIYHANLLGMRFVKIPKGKIRLGGSPTREPQQDFVLHDDYYLGEAEITQQQWEEVMQRNQSRFAQRILKEPQLANINKKDLQTYPMDSLSWADCQEFVKEINEMIVNPQYMYRLPTANEWEYACRGGPAQPAEAYRHDYYAKAPHSSPTELKANYAALGLGRPMPVKSYPPNGLSLYDMHGNVFEFCDDLKRVDQRLLAIHRGGSWDTPAETLSASVIQPVDRTKVFDAGGFRLAYVPKTYQDRVVAAWLVKQQSPFIVLVNKQQREITSVRDIPDEAFSVIAIDLRLNKELSNDELAMFRHLRSLTTLNLSSSSVTGDGLNHLSANVSLSQLHLNFLSLTDADLQALAALPLEQLYLSYTQITDRAMRSIRGFSKLTDLNLEGCPITDASLKDLTTASQLRTLNLKKTKTTPAAIRELASQLPQCNIISDIAPTDR